MDSRYAMDVDHDQQPPQKRQRTMEYATQSKISIKFEALPLPVLLLSLSSLVLHPPTHREYSKSLYLSFLSTYKCLSYQNLDADLECRAWMQLAELGFRLGLGEQDMEDQVETAITKALLISQNHPTLRPYKVHLTVLSARISQYQRKWKLSQTTLRRLLATYITPHDLPHLIYTAHLGHIASFSIVHGSGSLVPSPQSLKAIQDMHELAMQNNHPGVVTLSAILRLQTLVQMGYWDAVQEAVDDVEQRLSFPGLGDPAKLAESAASFAHAKRPIQESAFLVYALVLGMVFYTYTGNTPAVDARTKVLHEMLDGGALELFKYGVVEIPFPCSQPLCIQMTQPRILMILAFLITSVAKRDPVGRKPKRKVFAIEGLLVVEKELKKDPHLAPWASVADVDAHFSRLNKLKADLICELVGVAVMRSEFAEAERHISELIAHTRNEGLFNLYSARISLLHAQLAHALNQTERALQCYQVAAYLSRPRHSTSSPSSKQQEQDESDDDGAEDVYLNTAARAGELWLRIGVLRCEVLSQPPGKVDEEWVKEQEEELQRVGKEVVRDCEGLGSTLASVACVLKACLTNEFLKAKMHLRQGLKLATQSTDNHLRALIMALIASQYLNTSTEHAEAMLATAEQLAAGLGAQPRAAAKTEGGTPTPAKKSAHMDGVGNAPLRLWIGERSAELKRRAGDEDAARLQESLNYKLKGVVRRIEMRKLGGVGLGTPTK